MLERGGRAVPDRSATTVAEVVIRLEGIDARLAPSDGVAAFNRMYLTVTRLVRDRVSNGFFADPARMERLDVLFANLYLAAVAAAEDATPVPKPWRPLFERRGDSRVEAIQFAIAGMNAHINHDLAVACAALCQERGSAPGDGTFHGDFVKVNQVLAEVDQDVREMYVSGAAAELDHRLAPVLDLVGIWSIERARDAAWANAEVLWQLRHFGPVRDQFVTALGGTVGLATATLVTPVALPP